jgi:O-acetyl-ADP-ribose deacetylase (regulator of RNase III)
MIMKTVNWDGDDPRRTILTYLQAQLPDPWERWSPDLDPDRLIRALGAARPPGPLPPEVALAWSTYLDRQRAESVPVDPRDFPAREGGLAIWRGDITRLAADAIVNAANSALLGCFHPLHACIDNAIHSAAGPGLRLACAELMGAQGHPEPVGQAKVTPGFHLPSRYVIHTVGPQVPGAVQPGHRRDLEACYRSVLEAAATLPDVRTLAFCSISTGVFGYPIEEAAPVAVGTVRTWLFDHPGRFDRVIFDVFSAEDEEVYRGQF